MRPETPKYRNIVQMNLGVSGVDEELSQGERLVLIELAHGADYRTGLSRPGNERLRKVAGIKTHEGVRYILRRLRCDRRLIECVSKGNGGRGLATVWRIKFEDPRFPSPNKPPSNDLEDTEEETPKYSTENPQVIEAKPPSNEAETPKPGASALPKSLPKNPTTPLPAPAKLSGALAEGWMDLFLPIMGKPSKSEQSELRKLAEKHNDEFNLGPEYVRRAVIRFQDRPKGLEGLKQRWLWFLKEAEGYIAAVIKEKWSEHPVRKAAQERDEQRDLEEAQKRNAAIRAASAAADHNPLDIE